MPLRLLVGANRSPRRTTCAGDKPESLRLKFTVPRENSSCLGQPSLESLSDRSRYSISVDSYAGQH
jgi:hypothetical protein